MTIAMVHKLAGQVVADPLVQKVLSALRTTEDLARFLAEVEPRSK